MRLKSYIVLLLVSVIVSCTSESNSGTQGQIVEKNSSATTASTVTLGQTAQRNLSAPTFPSMESGRYKEYCEEEWTKKGVIDQNMARFCQGKEVEGYYEALAIIKRFENQEWIQDAINYSINQWTKKGSRQDRMVAHTLKKITDGFEEIVIASKKPDFDKNKYQRCYQKWSFQYDMVWFCYKN